MDVLMKKSINLKIDIKFVIRSLLWMILEYAWDDLDLFLLSALSYWTWNSRVGECIRN